MTDAIGRERFEISGSKAAASESVLCLFVPARFAIFVYRSFLRTLCLSHTNSSPFTPFLVCQQTYSSTLVLLYLSSQFFKFLCAPQTYFVFYLSVNFYRLTHSSRTRRMAKTAKAKSQEVAAEIAGSGDASSNAPKGKLWRSTFFVIFLGAHC